MSFLNYLGLVLSIEYGFEEAHKLLEQFAVLSNFPYGWYILYLDDIPCWSMVDSEYIGYVDC